MRILVIGGTGFIGPHVVRRLAAQGHDVTLFHRGQTEAELPPNVSRIHGDRAHLADFRETFRRLAPAVVLDMRSLSEADALAVANAVRGNASRLVAISSMDVYRAYGRLIGTEPGPPDPIPTTEESPLRERLYPYRTDPLRAADDPAHWMDDYDKLLVERVVLGNPALPGTILRLPMVHGPGDNQHRLFPYLKRMDDRRPAILLSTLHAAWNAPRGYVENVADAIALAVADDRAAGQIYNVADPAPLAEADWVRAIAQQSGWDGEIVTLPSDHLPESMRDTLDFSQDWTADSTRIRTDLGYAERIPRPEALRRTIAWERANPPSAYDPAAFDYVAEDEVLSTIG
ncbi:MAG TPA: NAD-dependent epimerase/dehydratase family protein [Thermomicrobiales bacterium]